jgi:hypothetical protein
VGIVAGEGAGQGMCCDVVLGSPVGALTKPGGGTGFSNDDRLGSSRMTITIHEVEDDVTASRTRRTSRHMRGMRRAVRMSSITLLQS